MTPTFAVLRDFESFLYDFFFEPKVLEHLPRVFPDGNSSTNGGNFRFGLIHVDSDTSYRMLRKSADGTRPPMPQPL
jgi:hypothetical protein